MTAQFNFEGLGEGAVAPAQPKAKKAVIVPVTVGAFFNALSNLKDKARIRVTYGACTKVLVAAGALSPACEKVAQACIPHVNKLPLNQQWLVCDKNGKYSEVALAKWRQAAPQDFASVPYVKDPDRVLAAFHAGIAASKSEA